MCVRVSVDVYRPFFASHKLYPSFPAIWLIITPGMAALDVKDSPWCHGSIMKAPAVLCQEARHPSCPILSNAVSDHLKQEGNS